MATCKEAQNQIKGGNPSFLFRRHNTKSQR